MKTYVIAIALLLSPIAALRAEEPQEESQQLVQEVFQSELVYPQDKGEVQITAGSVWHDERGGRLNEVPLQLEYGLTDRWQVDMAVTEVSHRFDGGESSRGFGDLEIGTKYAFMNIGGSHTHAAIGADLTLPTGNEDRDLGEGLVQFEPYLAIGHDLQSLNNAHVFGQVALGLMRRSGSADGAEGDPAHELSLNSGLIVPINHARLVAEVNWSSNRWNHDGDESSLFVTPGVVWDLPGTWEVGVGVPIGLTNDGDRFRVAAQLIYEFGGDGH